MPTIIHTGQGVYTPVKESSYDPIEAVKEAGRVRADLMKYDYAVRKEREKQFLELVDIKTENMLVDALQKEAANQINGFTEKAISLEQKYKGKDLPIEAHMELQKEKRKVEQWQADRLSEAQKAVKMLDYAVKDNGATIDMDETIANINEFYKDPLHATVKEPVMRFKSVDESWHDILKFHPLKIDSETRDYSANGVDYEQQTIRNHAGLEDDQSRFDAAMKGYDENFHLSRTINHEFQKLKTENPTQYKKYADARDYYSKIYAPQFALPEIINRKQIDKRVPASTGGGLNLNFGISSGGYIASAKEDFTNEKTNTKEKAILLQKSTGNGGMTFTMNEAIETDKGEPIKTTANDVIEGTLLYKDWLKGNMYKGSQVIDKEASVNELKEQGIDDPSNAAITAKVYEMFGGKRSVIYKDGKYYISKPIDPQVVWVNLNKGKNRVNIMNEFGSKIKDKEGKAKTQVEQFLGVGSTKQSAPVKKETPPKVETKLPDL